MTVLELARYAGTTPASILYWKEQGLLVDGTVVKLAGLTILDLHVFVREVFHHPSMRKVDAEVIRRAYHNPAGPPLEAA